MRALVFLLALSGSIVAAAAVDDTDTCLVVSAENIVTGTGNWYLYVDISSQACTFAAGDHLEYDILLPALNPTPKGGIDAQLDRGGAPRPTCAACLRDCGIKDQAGVDLHGDGLLSAARETWYHRSFDLTPVAGCTARCWQVAFEGDRPGLYVQFLDNIRVVRGDQTVCTIYENGPAPEIKVRLNEGYSREVLITAASRAHAYEDAAVKDVLVRARRENELRAAREHFRATLDIARTLAAGRPADPVHEHLRRAAELEDNAAYEERRVEAYLESLARAQAELSAAQPLLERYAGHLVGHAHIDLQWLWSWDETVKQIIPDTFGQAVKFIQEFPGFTFSQSSAALYLATEEHHPELFKRMQEFVRKGQWEIVGGRWCEGDLNMISPESHARHFLYAQRYFQQKFGRICTAGFEPDTFGHPWTMPQLLRQAGIRSYYFCRGGSGRPGRQGGPPLFWWEGPDGSRVLAFDEAALDSWYIGSVTDDKVRKLAEFAHKTGAHDYLMVYGVGNHGGGPTRENIEAAIAMRDRQPWPQIKFSTLTGFFDRLYEQVDQLHIPTLREEVNPVFEGCYTSHSRIKKYNRDCEVLLTSTETFAALATLAGAGGSSASAGLTYPRAELELLWRDLLWNHHHDTLCGSFVHASSAYSAKMYEALLKRGSEIGGASQQALAARIRLDGRGPFVVVFNPLAWPRSEVVDASFELPESVVTVTLSDAEGDVPAQRLSRGPSSVEPTAVNIRVCFLARNVPGCGFKTFTVHPQGELPVPPPTDPNRDGQGAVIQPRFQILHEKPHAMSAWEIGEMDQVVDLDEPAEVKTDEDGWLRRRVSTHYKYDQSSILQITTDYPGIGRTDYEAIIHWKQVGSPEKGSDMLKVAFPTGVRAETATYDIPFGDVARKNDGHENAALKWCDLSDAGHGVTVLNDCKHAYDVKDGVIRLTLLRTSYEPDPRPDVGEHRMRYAVISHDGPLDKRAAARAAWELNSPLQVFVRPFRHMGVTLAGDVEASIRGTPPLPATWSGCQVEPANIIVTCLKLAEDNDDFIVRAYECAGRQTNATFTLGFDAQGVTETDLLERGQPEAARAVLTARALTADFKPYQIRTFRLRR